MFNTLSFKGKIVTLVGAAVLGVSLITAMTVVHLRENIFEGRRSQLVTAVQAANSIVLSYQAQATAGKLTTEAAQKAAIDTLRSARYGGADGKADYYYIFGTDGTGVMHPFKPDWVGQPMFGKVKDAQGRDGIRLMADNLKASPDGRAIYVSSFNKPGQTESVPKLQHVVEIKGWNWMVGSGLYLDDVDAQINRAIAEAVGLAFGVLLVIGGVGFVIGRDVLRQIGGEPAQAVAVMKEVADGNLGVNVPKAAAGSLLDSLAVMVASLGRTVGQVRSATDSISTASAEIATGNADLASRTEHTSSNLQQAASSMEQLTGTVKQSADSARTANQLASSAAQVAERGGQVVAQVVTTMDEINTSSKKIADIIGVIDGIAFQTNILALNAAVEAARAGEQGRGFAVVASEVRSLAQRSADAAKEIKTLIGASVDRVESGSKLVADAGSTMNEIVASVQRVSDIIGEISAASSEQSDGIGTVNTAVVQLDQMTQQNAALVEESAAAAESLKDQAKRLAELMSTFRLQPGSGAAAFSAPAAPAPAAASAPKPAFAPSAQRKPAPVAKPVPKTPSPAPASRPKAAAPAQATLPPVAAKSGAPDGDWETF